MTIPSSQRYAQCYFCVIFSKTVRRKVILRLNMIIKAQRWSTSIASSILSLMSVLARGEWQSLRSGRFIYGKDAVPIVQEAG